MREGEIMASCSRWVMLTLTSGAFLAGWANSADDPYNNSTLANKVPAVDHWLAKYWDLRRVTASNLISDQAFVRRVYLDLIGRVPRPREITQYDEAPRDVRDAKLVDRLLASPEFTAYQASTWTVTLLGREGKQADREQFRAWLAQRFGHKEFQYDKLIWELVTAEGTTAENPAVLFLLLGLGDEKPREEWEEHGRFDAWPATRRILRVFLGLRLPEARDHRPHRDFGPKAFHGVNCFLRQLDTPRPGELFDNFAFNVENNVYYLAENQERSIGATFLDGNAWRGPKGRSRRPDLARQLTVHRNLAPTLALRVWMQLFGRSLCEQNLADDLGGHNKPRHFEILAEIATYVRRNNFDVRPLLRALCLTKAYRLSTAANDSNWEESSEVAFARMPLKVLTPEQLVESLLVATEGLSPRSPEEAARFRQACLEGLTGTADELVDRSIAEKLRVNMEIVNQDVVLAALSRKNGLVARALAKSKGDDYQAASEIFLSILGRRPRPQEMNLIRDELKAGREGSTAVWEDLAWALLNSNEFVLNH
jgi:hypothetical protein